jgi:hypothetical protein
MTATRATAKALAHNAGRTRLVHMTGGAHDLALFIAPDQDLDGEFLATCAETGDCLCLRGWLLDLHDGADDRAALAADFGDWREPGFWNAAA